MDALAETIQRRWVRMRLPQDYILHIESEKDGVHITAEWQGELVRCKDCKHWHSNTEFCDIWSYPNVAQRTLNNDYCSLGKRREGSEVEE